MDIQPATFADCAELAPLLRREDAAEVEAGGETVLGALQDSLRGSSRAYAVRFDGELAALCGVVPVPTSDTAVAWCLTGKVVARRKKDFLRVSRVVLASLSTEARTLVAAVDARYTGALRWARWMGFEVGEAQPFGPECFPFHLVTRSQTWA